MGWGGGDILHKCKSSVGRFFPFGMRGEGKPGWGMGATAIEEAGVGGGGGALY